MLIQINVDDGIERTTLFSPVLPYKKIRCDSARSDRLFKLHGDAAYEINYHELDNIVFDQNEYRKAMEADENITIRNNIITAYKEFNLIFIGCSLDKEPDLEWFYNSVKDEKADTKIFYVTKRKVDLKREAILETYGATDIIRLDDYNSFYIDLVHEYNSLNREAIDFPFVNPVVKIVEDKKFRHIYGVKSFEERINSFFRSDILIDRLVYYEINKAFQDYNIVVLSGRRFSGRTSLMSQICKNDKTRKIYYFPSSSSFDFDVVENIVKSSEPALLLFDSNAMQPDVYLGMSELEDLVQQNNHHILAVETLEDTYFTENINCKIVRLKPRFEKAEIDLLNRNLDRYGLIHRNQKERNLDYLTRLKEQQNIDFPDEFNFSFILSNVEEKMLLILAAQDKVFSRDLRLIRISDRELAVILARLDRLCEKIPTVKGESRSQSTYKIVHNSRAMILYLLRHTAGTSQANVAGIVKELVKSFYQNKDRMQKQIAISIMQFDTLNEVYGGTIGAGRLIERVYEELQEVLNFDPHYWLQRSKCIYRQYPTDINKLKEAYQYCVKAKDADNLSEKLDAQTSLSLSLISALLYSQGAESDLNFAEQCIIHGFAAMHSSYYSWNNRERLEKERIGRHQSYEELCLKVCSEYICDFQANNTECQRMALNIFNMLKE